MEIDYIRPANTAELKTALKKMKKQSVIFAGGTDLMVKMRHKSVVPEQIIDIKGIKSFKEIKKGKSSVSIGACVTMNELFDSALMKKEFPALAQAAFSVGAHQIRNRATIAGNICNASPAADTTPALLIYNAVIKVISSGKSRKISIHDFFKGPGQTVLKKGECVESIELPLEKGNSIFYKFSRRKALDLSTVCIATGVFGKDDYRVAVGACAAITARAAKTEEYLKKNKISAATSEKAADLLPLKPISDLRGSAEFREKIAKKLFIRSVTALTKKGAK